MRFVSPTGTAGQKVFLTDGTAVTTDAYGQVNITPSSSNSSAIIALLAAGFVALDPPEVQSRLPMVAGNFYTGGPGDSYGAILTIASTIYLTPIYVPNQVTLKTLSALTTTGQTGGAVQMGVYFDNAGVPGLLVPGSNTGSAAACTAGGASTSTLSTPISLDSGWYWTASTFTASSTMPTVAGVSALMAGFTSQNMGGDTAAHALAITAAGAQCGWTGTYTYAAVPQTLPTLALSVNTVVPAVAIGL